MSEEEDGLSTLVKHVNCFSDENMNLLAILGLDKEKPMKRPKTKEKPRKRLVEFSSTWKRSPGIALVEEDGISTLTRKDVGEDWCFARMKGFFSGDTGTELSWSVSWCRSSGQTAAIAAGVEDQNGAHRLFDFQSGRTQDENNRQEQLFEEILDGEIVVRFRLSFLQKKVVVSVNGSEFKPAFRVATSCSYVPIVAFSSNGTVKISEVALK